MKFSVNNAMTKIIDGDDEVINQIDDLLSYSNPSAEYSYNNCKRSIARFTRLLEKENTVSIIESYKRKLRQLNFLLNKADKERKVYMIDTETDSFPTGLLDTVLDFLDEKGIKWELNDDRNKNLKTKTLKKNKEFPELRYYQEEALEEIVKGERGIVVSATGTGKSLMIAKACELLKVKTIVIVPSVDILDGMLHTLQDIFGKSNVKKLSKSTKPGHITVGTIQTLVKMDPKVIHEFEACIIDEFHRSASASYHSVNSDHLKNCYYRLGFTATNFRNRGDDMALIAILSNVLYTYSAQRGIDDGFLVKPEIKWINNKVKAPNKYQAQYKAGIVENEERNAKIAEIVNNHKDDSVIVLVQQIEHGEILKELIPNSTFISGKEKAADRKEILQEFREGNIKLLIGTSVLGEGVDLPIANVLILSGGGKAKSQVVQNVGRVLRPFPGKEKALIYDFLDKGAKYLEIHAEEREEIYLEYYPGS